MMLETSVPLAGSSGQYQAQIYNVTVHCFAAGQSG